MADFRNNLGSGIDQMVKDSSKESPSKMESPTLMDKFINAGGYDDNNELDINEFIVRNKMKPEEMESIYNQLTEDNFHNQARTLKDNYNNYNKGLGLRTRGSELTNSFLSSQDKDNWINKQIDYYNGWRANPRQKEAIGRYFNAMGIPLDKMKDYLNDKSLNPSSRAREIFDNYEKYRNTPFGVALDGAFEGKDDEYRYRMLDRLEQDLKYYLGHGLYGEHNLWNGGGPEETVRLMKGLYDSLPEKPRWINKGNIDDYEQALNANVTYKPEYHSNLKSSLEGNPSLYDYYRNEDAYKNNRRFMQLLDIIQNMK